MSADGYMPPVYLYLYVGLCRHSFGPGWVPEQRRELTGQILAELQRLRKY